ncbi:TRAP transporter small permease [Brevibacillus sp. LEMMJ03]|jgi:C4-dicarboxylate transporter, DctQ subunit|uniref:TRAP transporter small permease n=1 Tax=Brevibacillus sp. LEMMJ03 TaxID=2595056 RepID=UPI00117C721A|nr:TRAP transporter small permease [Brevibacillus sp. LEMMJ03]TRY25960.1 TRAP transporter small permease [Brevibacillus sp. LEMMJ03]
MKWFSYLYRWMDRLILWGGMAAGILIVVTTGMIFYEIVSRSLFDAPTTWATELSVYAIIGSCFIGAAYAVRTDAHIKVDLLLHNVPAAARRWLLIVSALLGLAFSLLFAVFGWEHVKRSMELGFTSTSLLQIPMYMPEMLLPIGGTLLSLAFLLQVVDCIRGGKGGEA